MPTVDVLISPSPSASPSALPRTAYAFLDASAQSPQENDVDARVQMQSSFCNHSFFEHIKITPPRKRCSASEQEVALAAATRNGEGDWRNHVGAPLVVPGCQLEWYSGSRLCDLLQSIGGLDLNGDSLIRHLHQTVRALAIGDLDAGLNRHMGNMSSICVCDWAYDDGHVLRFPGDISSTKNKQCRVNSLAFLTLAEVRAVWPDFCPKWGDVDYLPAYVWPPPKEARSPYHIVEGGLWSATGKLDMDTAKHYYNRRPGARRYVFATQWAAGRNKPPQFVDGFGDTPTREYNTIIRQRARDLNASVLDAFTVTFNTPSIDGQHYFQSANVDIAQASATTYLMHCSCHCLCLQVLFNLVAAMHLEDDPTSSS